METNRNIFNLLTLYFFIFFVLFTALYFAMPSFFNIGIIAFNMLISSITLIVCCFTILKISHLDKINDNNCDIIYFVCKNISIILYILNLIVSCILTICLKTTQSAIISLVFLLGYNTFYIFSQSIFNNILQYSEHNYRNKTISIANPNIFFRGIPLTINLIFEIAPLIILNSILVLLLSPLNIASSIYIIGLLIISILSIVYVAFHFYYSISKISENLSANKEFKFNNEFDNLKFSINTNKYIFNNEIEKEHLASIEIIRRTVDAKDAYTMGHSNRVSKYSVLIGKNLGLSEEELKTLSLGGLFHDIGKIGIPDKVLLKEGKLTDDEYLEIKKHPSIGVHILENSDIFKNILPIVLHHHERFDGKGYPSGLKGNEIPYLARIVSVADTFDAMTSKRVYRNSMPISTVKEEIKKCSGTQFDANISNAFLSILENDFDSIKEIMQN